MTNGSMGGMGTGAGMAGPRQATPAHSMLGGALCFSSSRVLIGFPATMP